MQKFWNNQWHQWKRRSRQAQRQVTQIDCLLKEPTSYCQVAAKGPSYFQRSNKIIQEIIINISNWTNQSPYPSHSPLWQMKKDSILQTILCLCWTTWTYGIQWFSFQFWGISFPSEASNTYIALPSHNALMIPTLTTTSIQNSISH